MSGPDWLTPVVTFAIGLGLATAAWWIYGLVRARSESRRATVSAPTVSGRVAERAEPLPPTTSRSLIPEPGALRTSQRVVLHLSRQPRLAFGDVAPGSITQAGMTRALSVSQPALARVLRRLVDGGAVLEMRTHVAGQPQRLKVYQLTVHGEAIARDLRARSAPLIRPRVSEPVAEEGESRGSEIAEP